MKWLYFALFAGASLAQDITFTNRTATFTNLEGRLFTNVTLIKATENGVVWKGEGLGMVPYTNLNPEVLESFGVPPERIEEAKAKAAKNAERRRKSDVSGLKTEAALKRHQDPLKIEAGMSPQEKLEEVNMGGEEARREFVRYDYGENPTDRLLRNYDRLTRILGPNHESYYSIDRTNMSAYELGELMENQKLFLQTLTDLRERRAIVDRDIKQLEIDSRQRLLKSILFGD